MSSPDEIKEYFRRRREMLLSRPFEPWKKIDMLIQYSLSLEDEVVALMTKLKSYELYDVSKIILVENKNNDTRIIDRETIAKIAEENRKTDVVKSEDENGISLYCHIAHGVFRITISNATKEVALLSDVTVDENIRGRGIGNKILSESEVIAKQHGCSVISLQVKETSWMKDWYARHGYSVVADGYAEDMIMMSKKCPS